SEVEQCGNGARCVGRLVADRLARQQVRMDSPGGRVDVQLGNDGLVSVNMGVPNFDPSALPFEASREADIYPLRIGESELRISAVSMGNPHAVIQGRGRADLTAIANLVELPIYFIALFVLLPKFGLAGVAACWAGRTLLDYIILRLIAGRLLHAENARSLAEAASVFAIVVFIACVGAYPLALKIAGVGLTLCISAAIAYRFGLSPSKFFTLIRG
ncbi:MAG: hypothetical protein J0I86_20855, partial [Mesorhizobium sp.]|nr:hypothetical protein [Mesorhizobium sp.]